MVSHFIRTVVPLCTPHIRVDTVVEIDMGTQVITHSPNAIHFAAHIVAIYRYLAEVARRLLAMFPSLFGVTDCVGLFKFYSLLSHKTLQSDFHVFFFSFFYTFFLRS